MLCWETQSLQNKSDPCVSLIFNLICLLLMKLRGCKDGRISVVYHVVESPPKSGRSGEWSGRRVDATVLRPEVWLTSRDQSLTTRTTGGWKTSDSRLARLLRNETTVTFSFLPERCDWKLEDVVVVVFYLDFTRRVFSMSCGGKQIQLNRDGNRILKLFQGWK